MRFSVQPAGIITPGRHGPFNVLNFAFLYMRRVSGLPKASFSGLPFRNVKRCGVHGVGRLSHANDVDPSVDLNHIPYIAIPPGCNDDNNV